MKLFLVSPRAESKDRVKQLIETQFPDNNILLPERDSHVWVLAAPNDQTPGEIAKRLNMGTGEQNNSGLVVRIAEYDGYDFRSIWQQFEAWLGEGLAGIEERIKHLATSEDLRKVRGELGIIKWMLGIVAFVLVSASARYFFSL